MHELREEVRPLWPPFRLPGGTPEGLQRRTGDSAFHRLLRGSGLRIPTPQGSGLQIPTRAPLALGFADADPIHLAACQGRDGRVILGARAETAEAARWGLQRLRFSLGIDDDLAEFHERFRDDPVIGKTVRALPHLRPFRRPDPWEALVCAITEQLIEFDRAIVIQRRMINALSPRCPATGLRLMPDAHTLAGVAPAQLCKWDLAETRGFSLRTAAKAVARGTVDLDRGDATTVARQLRTIPGIGPWTVECVALHGYGRLDVVPAMDLGYIKLVGRLVTGHPKARADEPEVRGFFARYDGWAGLAARYLTAGAGRGWLPDRLTSPAPRARVPAPADRRSSSPTPRAVAA